MKISVVICTRNAENVIADCLKSVAFADEIVVVDDGSTDKTLEIVKKYTKNIYHHTSVGYVEPVRNFAINKATNEWILLLDADERVPKTLAEKINELLAMIVDDIVAVYIPRKNIIFNKWIEHSGWWPDHQIRLFRKGSVIWQNKIHSVAEVKGKAMLLENVEQYAIEHFNYNTIASFIQRLDRYTEVESKEQSDDIKTGDFISHPFHEFLSRFFAREGYKDGEHGLVLSILEGYYAFILAAKKWEKNEARKTVSIVQLHKTITRLRREYIYWYYTVRIEQTKNPFKLIYFKIRRRIQI